MTAIMRSRLAAGIAAAMAVASLAAVPAIAAEPISFLKGMLQGESSTYPTSLQFGPDGRLYVAQQNGVIFAYTIARNGPADYVVSDTERISLIRKIPNHDDDGTPNPDARDRQLTGLLVTGTASDPIIYATSSDPRFVLPVTGGGDSGLDTNSGVISRLTRTGTRWERFDLVRGLARSEEVHATNGLALDEGQNVLYAAQGGNTNAGAPSALFGFLPEYALSTAVLSIDLDAIGETTYDLPTLNDPSRPGNPDTNDPFGGNDGLNQAKLTRRGPVQVHSGGYRNPFDVVITEAGRMYVTDNGGNAAHGSVPVGEGPEGTCTNDPVELGGETTLDTLHLVTAGYYGGYPNPTRGNTANTFGGHSPVWTANPIECDFRTPGVDSPAVTTFSDSTNGIDEYTATEFGGALTGDLLAVGWGEDSVSRVKLAADGTTVLEKEVLFSNVGRKPLDVTTRGDTDPYPGTVWVTDHHWSRIFVFEPTDASGCTGADDPGLDEDGDGYTNADEVDNGTSPCSAADAPSDFDGDHVSDLNDPDDDRDGIADAVDPFAVDKHNGSDTNLPIGITWDAGDSPPRGLEETGFRGLMTNGIDEYTDQYDPSLMTIGGAGGILTVDQVPEGDAKGTANTQEYGFQRGVPVEPGSGAFVVRARVLQPFAGLSPEPGQSMGIAFGTGSQTDYVKLVVRHDGIQFLREVADVVTARRSADVALPGPDHVDLFLEVDPGAATVSPSFRVTEAGLTGPRVGLGGPSSIPAAWLSAATEPAAGIIATSAGAGEPFPATWDFFEVEAVGGATAAPAAAGTWELRAPTGLPRAETSYRRIGARFYLAGGGTAHQVYLARRDAWRDLAPFPVGIDHSPAAAFGGRVYYLGGLVPGSVPDWPHFKEVFIYDPETDEFTQGAPMREARGRGAGTAVVYQGKIYLAGGQRDGNAVPWFDVYDPQANTWRRLPDMPRARHHHFAGVVDGKLYVIGGRPGNFGDTDVYDFATGEWTTGLAPLPTLRSGGASAVVGGRILTIGGEGRVDDVPQVFDTVEAYVVGRDRWRTLTPMPTARHGIDAVVWEGGVYVAAGGAAPKNVQPTDVHEVLFASA